MRFEFFKKMNALIVNLILPHQNKTGFFITLFLLENVQHFIFLKAYI